MVDLIVAVLDTGEVIFNNASTDPIVQLIESERLDNTYSKLLNIPFILEGCYLNGRFTLLTNRYEVIQIDEENPRGRLMQLPYIKQIVSDELCIYALDMEGNVWLVDYIIEESVNDRFADKLYQTVAANVDSIHSLTSPSSPELLGVIKNGIEVSIYESGSIINDEVKLIQELSSNIILVNSDYIVTEDNGIYEIDIDFNELGESTIEIVEVIYLDYKMIDIIKIANNAYMIHYTGELEMIDTRSYSRFTSLTPHKKDYKRFVDIIDVPLIEDVEGNLYTIGDNVVDTHFPYRLMDRGAYEIESRKMVKSARRSR